MRFSKKVRLLKVNGNLKTFKKCFKLLQGSFLGTFSGEKAIWTIFKKFNP